MRNFEAFVISGDADNFSVGANLMQLLLSIQEGEWDEVDFADPRLPEDDRGHQVLPAAGGGGAVSASAWAAARRSPCTAARRQAHAETVHGAGGNRRRAAARQAAAARR